MEKRKNDSLSYINYSALIVICVLSVIAGALVSGNYFLYKISQNVPDSDDNTATSTERTINKKYNTQAFAGVNILADSAVVFDPITKETVYVKDPDTARELASVTKVMTAYVAYTYISKDQSITIIPSDLLPEGSSNIKVGDVWKRDSLIEYTLSVSSNDGARALARTAGELDALTLGLNKPSKEEALKWFVQKMNDTARDLNLPSLVFYNESGLDVDSYTNGGYGNAKDTAKLFAKVYGVMPEVFETTTKNISYIDSSTGSKLAKNTNGDADSIPGLAMSKTGFTDLALGNLGVVIEMGPANPVVIVVLHSTKEGRFSDIEKLRKATLESLR